MFKWVAYSPSHFQPFDRAARLTIYSFEYTVYSYILRILNSLSLHRVASQCSELFLRVERSFHEFGVTNHLNPEYEFTLRAPIFHESYPSRAVAFKRRSTGFSLNSNRVSFEIKIIRTDIFV